MRRLLLLFLLGTMIGAACAGAGERATTVADGAPAPALAAASAPAEDTARIVFLGDSLSRGLGLASEESVPALIQARLDAAGHAFRVVNRGNSGDTSASGLRQLEDALAGDVRILVLELGANDMLRGLTVEQMRENLQAIIERSREQGVEVLLTGMEALPNYGEDYTTRYRAAFRELAQEYDLVFMPFFLEGVAGDPALNQGDMMHPNAEGAQVVADNLWRYLESMLAAAGPA